MAVNPNESILTRDLRVVLKTVEGRRFLYNFLVLSGLFRDGATDDSTLLFSAGRRSLGLDLMKQLNLISPDAFPKLLLEFSNVALAPGAGGANL